MRVGTAVAGVFVSAALVFGGVVGVVPGVEAGTANAAVKAGTRNPSEGKAWGVCKVQKAKSRPVGGNGHVKARAICVKQRNKRKLYRTSKAFARELTRGRTSVCADSWPWGNTIYTFCRDGRVYTS